MVDVEKRKLRGLAKLVYLDKFVMFFNAFLFVSLLVLIALLSYSLNTKSQLFWNIENFPIKAAILLLFLHGIIAGVFLFKFFHKIDSMIEERNLELDARILMEDELVRKVNEHKGLIQKIQDSEAKLKVVIDSLVDGVLVCNKYGAVTLLNPSLEKLFSKVKDDLLEQNVFDLFKVIDPVSLEEVTHPIKALLGRSESLVANPHTLVEIEGVHGRIHVSFKASAMKDYSGKITGCVMSFQNLTDEIQLQEKLKQNQQFEAVVQLADGIAYDFNNLLTGIIGLVDLLKLRVLDHDPNYKYLQEIYEITRKGCNLTFQLLSLSKADSDERVDFDFVAIVKELENIVRHTVNPQIEFICSFPDENLVVHGSPGALESSILNLLINARDAIGTKGRIVFALEAIELGEFEVPTLETGSYLKVTISDNGCGIEAEDLEQIFEPLYTTKKINATGLGISSALSCFRDHQGDMLIESELGKGTELSIYLPHEKGKEVVFQKGSLELQKGSELILLIDDEPSVQYVVGDMLEELGYSVITASNGEEGLELYKQHQDSVKLVILDMMMPVMDGRECLCKLRDFDREVKVLIASGFSPGEDLDKCLELGIQGFIQKPFMLSALADHVSCALRLTPMHV